MPARAAPSLMAKALGWLAQREHSSAQLKARLQRWLADRPAAESSSAELERVLQTLQAQGYLSDERFVQSRVRLRSARFGNRRIEQELRQHGATLDAPTRQHLRDSEFERACQVWQQRFGRQPPTPPDARAQWARQQRFLCARGFTAETIARVMKHCGGHHREPASDADSG